MAKYISDPLLSEVQGVKHAFFTREGGVSSGLYASLNTGLASGDLRESVLKNREIVASDLGISVDKLVNCYQVHSNLVVQVGEGGLPEEPKADGMVTGARGIALVVFTADCAPVLFADPESQIIGAAHVGWRGSLSGICEAIIAQMEELGAGRNRIVAAVGPCIQQESYEVGDEVLEMFTRQAPEHRQFFSQNVKTGKAHFDLPGFVQHQLQRLGIASISKSAEDTYSDASMFYSARRALHLGERVYGRMLSAVMLKT